MTSRSDAVGWAASSRMNGQRIEAPINAAATAPTQRADAVGIDIAHRCDTADVVELGDFIATGQRGAEHVMINARHRPEMRDGNARVQKKPNGI